MPDPLPHPLAGLDIVTPLPARIAAMDRVLASSTVLDRAVLEKAMQQLYGLSITDLDPKIKAKVRKAVIALVSIAGRYPDAADPAKPMSATLLVEHAYWLQVLRNVVNGMR